MLKRPACYDVVAVYKRDKDKIICKKNDEFYCMVFKSGCIQISTYSKDKNEINCKVKDIICHGFKRVY